MSEAHDEMRARVAKMIARLTDAMNRDDDADARAVLVAIGAEVIMSVASIADSAARIATAIEAGAKPPRLLDPTNDIRR